MSINIKESKTKKKKLYEKFKKQSDNDLGQFWKNPHETG